MKKAVVLGMILLALGCMAYAQGVTVGMDFGRTQFDIASSNSNAGASIDQGWLSPNTSFPMGQRMDMQFAWSNEHTALNITGYLNNSHLTATMDWANVYGTLKLVPDMFKLMIGFFGGDGFDDFRADSAHPIRDISNGNIGRMNGWGIIGVLQPKDSGLEVAVFYQTGDPSIAGAQNSANNTVMNTEIAASFNLANLIKISAGSSIGSGPATNFSSLLYTPNRNFWGRVNLLMVPNLGLWADLRYDGFDQTPVVSNFNAEVAGSFDMKPLTLIIAAIYGSNDVLGTRVGTWLVEPEGIFNMGPISLGLLVGLSGTDVSGSGLGIEVEPYVKLNDFGLRVSFNFVTNTLSGSPSYWEIPLLIDWGF